MDTETNLEAEAPEVEDLPEVEETEEAATETDEDGNPEEEPSEPEEDSPAEFTAVEIDGKTYQIPAEVADKWMFNADYTRKTQALSEQSKAIEATLQQASQVTREEQAAMVAVGVIDTQLADYQNIDWDAWEQSDPQAANSAWRQYQMLKEQRQTVAGQYVQAQQQRTLMQQQETAKLLEQGQRELAAKIPGWGQDKASALQSHAIEAYGFTPQDLQTVVDPRMIQVLHDAWQFRQASKTQQAAKKVETQQAIKPAAKIPNGKPAARGLDDRMSAVEWVKQRNAQLATRNR